MLQKDEKIKNKKHKTEEQAARVAWRICKNWIEAQLAMVEAHMADMVEVFLPYAQTETGETIYQTFQNKNLKMLTSESE